MAIFGSGSHCDDKCKGLLGACEDMLRKIEEENNDDGQDFGL
jgi:hypothetical protein